MRALINYISRNWIWIIAGLVLTEALVKLSYSTRGYIAYGGEWLALPLVLLIAEAIRDVADVVRCLFEWGDDL